MTDLNAQPAAQAASLDARREEIQDVVSNLTVDAAVLDQSNPASTIAENMLYAANR